MLTENSDAATAAIEAGYASPSRFSCENNRLLGAPLLKDVTSLRQMPESMAVQERMPQDAEGGRAV